MPCSDFSARHFLSGNQPHITKFSFYLIMATCFKEEFTKSVKLITDNYLLI